MKNAITDFDAVGDDATNNDAEVAVAYCNATGGGANGSSARRLRAFAIFQDRETNQNRALRQPVATSWGVFIECWA